jgi:ribosomal protein S18 acetylase RimI-like enzyme
MDTVTLREARPEDGPAIAELVTALPQWFTPDVVETAPADAARQCAQVAVDAVGAVVGAVVWKLDGGQAEIEWLMVAPGLHRHGLGRRMVTDLAARLRVTGVARLTVATLAATTDYEPYARTRAFYEALGFVLARVEPAGWPDGTDKATYVLAL